MSVPTLYEANQVLHDGILVGEDENVLTSFVGFVFAEQPIVVQGFSGSGKSVMSDAVWDLIPEPVKYDYQMGTDKNIWYNTNFQFADYTYFQEWQKAAQSLDVVEAAKSWGEGKDYKREITVNEDGEKRTEETVLPRRPFLTTIADENEDGEVDEELGRRVIKLYANPGRGQTEKVVAAKAKEFSRPWDVDGADDATIDLVKARVKDVAGVDKRTVALPGFDEAFVDNLPMEFHDTRSVIDHFFNIITGVARYYEPDRTTFDDYLLATPTDLYEAYMLYREPLMNQCLRLENLGSRLLSVFPTIPEGDQYDPERHALTEGEVMEELKHQGIMLPKNKVRGILVKLAMTGYVEEDDMAATTLYRRSGIAENKETLTVSWSDVHSTVLDEAEESLDRSTFQNYQDTVNRANKKLLDPLTGENVDLMDHETGADPTVERAEEVKSQAAETSEEHKSFNDFGIEGDF